MDSKTEAKYQRLFMGGIQKHFPRNEAQAYKNLFTLDLASYCLRDFSINDLSESEVQCVERLAKKNNEFMNL